MNAESSSDSPDATGATGATGATDVQDADRRRWASRQLDVDGRFVLPWLEPGMDVLDVGCGPGSITRDLASRVHPGLTIGVDFDEHAVRIAREQVGRQDAPATEFPRLRFEVADASKLPLDDLSVDCVFANGLMEHLQDPAAALLEFDRVLRTGGLLALRSPDWGTVMLEPDAPVLRDSIELRNAWQRSTGGEPLAGRKIEGLVAANGYLRLHAGAESDPDGPAELLDYMLRVLRDAAFVDFCGSDNLATKPAIHELIHAWIEWSRRPGAFCATFWVSWLGRKPS